MSSQKGRDRLAAALVGDINQFDSGFLVESLKDKIRLGILPKSTCLYLAILGVSNKIRERFPRRICSYIEVDDPLAINPQGDKIFPKGLLKYRV